MTVKKLNLIFTLILTFSVYYFSGVGFDFSFLEKVALAGLALFFFLRARRRGPQQFYLFSLVALSIALSLSCALGSTKESTGPLIVEFTLNPWVIAFLSTLCGVGAWRWYERKKSSNKFALILFFFFILNWLILAFNVKYFEDWMLENVLTVIFAVIIYLTHRWFRFSNVSYGLIFLYMMLNVYGSHYTYAEVPFGFWLKDFLDLYRNHYDRIVHFSFGFLMAYPIREIVLRITAARGFWGLYIPIEFVLAFSAIYEILEWLIVVIYGGDLGIAYLGTQGDEWDAIKDMALAGGGAVLAMAIIMIILLLYPRRKFWAEFKSSLRVKDRAVLGERALRQLK